MIATFTYALVHPQTDWFASLSVNGDQYYYIVLEETFLINFKYKMCWLKRLQSSCDISEFLHTLDMGMETARGARKL
jgi:hypothetical protein